MQQYYIFRRSKKSVFFFAQALHSCRSPTTNKLPMHNSCVNCIVAWGISDYAKSHKYVNISLHVGVFRNDNVKFQIVQFQNFKLCNYNSFSACSMASMSAKNSRFLGTTDIQLNSSGGEEQPTRARWEQDVQVVIRSENSQQGQVLARAHSDTTPGYKGRRNHHIIALELKATFNPKMANMWEHTYITTPIACPKADWVRLSPRDRNHKNVPCTNITSSSH